MSVEILTLKGYSSDAETVKMYYLKRVFFWSRKLFKELPWKVHYVDATNCSKTLLGKFIMLMLQADQNICLKYVFVRCCKLLKDIT